MYYIYIGLAVTVNMGGGNVLWSSFVTSSSQQKMILCF